MRVVFWLMIVAGAAFSPDGRYVVGKAVSMLLDQAGPDFASRVPVLETLAGLLIFFTGVGGLIFMNRKRGRR